MKSVLFTAVGIAFGRVAPDIYSEPPSTVLGCECTGPCKSSLFFECNANRFCSVKDSKCAKGTADWSVSHGYYDYCVFEPYHEYEQRTAAEKQTIVMGHVVEDRHSGSYPSQLSVLTGIMGESVMESFDASSDVFVQNGRVRYIHSVGVVGGIRFDSVGGHPYTGLFKGAAHGLVRFSSAKEPSSAGTAPGMGIKFFRDGRPSANFVAMYSLDGQPCSDKNFFTHDWSNHISNTDNFGLKLIAAKFWQASYCPLMVGLSDLASNDDGSTGVFPFKLNFHALVESDCDCGNYAQCLQNLESIPAGTKLFEVRALDSPGGAEALIGHITLTGELTTSKFGDEELFIKHQHMEDDFALQPTWLQQIDRKTQCGMGCTGLTAPTIDKGCSSPFNSTTNVRTMLSDDKMIV